MKHYLILILFFSTILSINAQFTTQRPALDLTDVQIVDNTTSYVVGNLPTIDTTSESYLYKRIGSNNSFSLVQTLPYTRLAGCHFFTAQNGLMCGTVGNKSYLWRTTDGGTTLVSQPLSTLSNIYPTGFRFINSTIGYLYARSDFDDSKIYKTLDGGVTWLLVSENSAKLIEDISFLTASVGHRLIETPDSSAIEITRDGALTWQRLNAPEKPASYLFQTEQIGFVGTRTGEIWKTSNGGTTWSKLIKFPSNTEITQIKFPTPSVGYAIISQNKEYIYRTTDGGTTWQTVFIGAQNIGELISHLDCLNENTVVAVGLGAIVAANNAATMPILPLSTLLLSGQTISCAPVNMTLNFDLTGTPPWDIRLQDNTDIAKNFTATTTPFTTTYTPTNFANPYTLTALSVKGAGETTPSDFVSGTASLLKSTLINAQFIGNQSDTVCANGTARFVIQLEGCPPWSLRINDRNTIMAVDNIQTPNYVYTTQVNNISGNVSVEAVRSNNRDWTSVPASFGSIVFKAPPAKVTFNDNAQQSFCSNKDAIVPFKLEGLPPFNLTLSDGNTSVSVLTSSRDTFIIPSVNRSGIWHFTSATDGCGLMQSPNSFSLNALNAPNKPLDVAYNLNLQTNIVHVNWRDNNNNNIDAHQLFVYLNGRQAGIEAIGKQSEQYKLYDFFQSNKPVTQLHIVAYNTSTGCKAVSDTVVVTSLARTFRRDSFTETPPNTGIALADMNNDKLPDILAANGYYINKGNFVFEYHAQSFGGTPSVVGDMDNDGDLDFLVNNAMDGTTKVYFNNGNFNFTLKQTVEGTNATLFDYDFNGLLDIACTGKMYRNAGDNRYVLLPSIGNYGNVIGKPYYYDFDADGKLDLLDVYTSQDRGQIGYMHFEKVGTNTNNSQWYDKGNIAGATFVGTPQAVSFGDILGHSGSEDFVAFCGPYSDYHANPDYEAHSFMLFYGNGVAGHGYSTIGYTQAQNLEGFGEGALLDIDNSGNLEAIEKDGIGLDPINSNFGLITDKGFMSNGAPAVADFDNDGDLDIAVALPQGGFEVFENKFELGNNWLKIKLNARTTNRSGLGVWIKTTVNDSMIIATTVGGRHGGASRSDIIAHIGLGKATTINTIDVQWSPNKHTILRGVQANQLLTIDEPMGGIRPAYPIDIQMVVANTTEARLTWKDVATNENAYVVQRSTLSPDSGFIALDTLVANTTSYLTPIILSVTPTYYRVYALNAVANSAYSNTVSLSTPSVCDLITSVDTFFIAPEKEYSSCDSLVKLTVPQIAGYQYQWLLNDKPITNATTTSFDATQSGLYGMRVKTSAGCMRLLAPANIEIIQPITPQLAVENKGCISSTAILRTTPKSSDYHYIIQYREDATKPWSIAATSDSLVARQSGQYQTIVQNNTAGCTYKTPIVTVVIEAPLSFTIETSANPITSCKTPVTIKNLSINTPNIAFTWLKLINGDTVFIRTPSITVNSEEQNGAYILFGKDTVLNCEGYSPEVLVVVHYPQTTYKALDTIDCLGNGGHIWLNPPTQNVAALEYKTVYGWGHFSTVSFTSIVKVPVGTYRVVAKSEYLTTCQTIYNEITVKDTNFVISGKITLPNSTPSVSSLVQLLASDSSNPYSQIATTTTDSMGNYQFTSNEPRNYRILASVSNQPSIAPTYFGNVTILNSATTITPTECKMYLANIRLVSTNATVDFADKSLTINSNPNPFTDELRLDIESTHSEKVSFKLFNAHGIQLEEWTQTLTAPRSTWTIRPTIPNGLYFIKIENQMHEVKVLKVLKGL